MTIEIRQVDYTNPQDAAHLCALLDNYAQDKMGGSQALPQEVKANLAAELAKLPHAFSLIAYLEGQPVGLINCFQTLSTFKCKPLINIHDVTVVAECRGLGVSQKLLEKVEEIARERGCCKITLEVLEGNQVAQNAYKKFGFEGYELDPELGKALFWEKPLSSS